MTQKNKATPAATGEKLPPDVILNRELSQLAFNRRVLAQAEDPAVPLLERLRYLCIVSSNLDEFFEVRVASLLAQHRRPCRRRSRRPMRRWNDASAECHEIVERQYAILNSEVLPQLSAPRRAPAAPTRTATRRSAPGSRTTSTAKCGRC